MKIPAALFIILIIAGASACRSVTSDVARAAPSKVSISGGAVVGGGSTAEPTTNMREAVAAAEHAYREGGTAALERFVIIYPDAAISILRNGFGNDCGRALLDVYTKLFDADPAVFAELEQSRARGLELLKLKKIPEARKLLLASADAAGSRGGRYLQFELSVILSEGDLRADSAVERESRWREAILAGSGIHDCKLWRRALDAKPGDCTIPAECGSESKIYNFIGDAALRRGENTDALVDFTKAAAAASNDNDRATALLGQARALYLLGRRAESLVIAQKLVSGGGPVSRSALALSAMIHAGLGQLETARELLIKSLDGAGDWEGARRARADLGIVYLRLNDETRGLAELKSSRDQARAAGDWETLGGTLVNLSRYQKWKGIDTKETDAEMIALAREHGVVVY